MENCLILGARRYSFKDEQGQQREGVTLTYLTGEVETEGDRLGASPMSISGPLDIWRDLRTLPGYYEMEMRQRPGKNGRPSLHLAGVRFVEASELFPTVKTAATP